MLRLGGTVLLLQVATFFVFRDIKVYLIASFYLPIVAKSELKSELQICMAI